MRYRHGPAPLLTDRTAVVTGGSMGIGAAICAAFVAHGADVVSFDLVEPIDPPDDGQPGRFRHVTLDVTHPDAPARIAAEAAPDILVNNVGHFLRPPRPAAEEAADTAVALRAVNLESAVAVATALLPGMVDRDQGASIINLTTVEAHRAIPGHALYSAYKAGLMAWTRSAAVEYGRHGIRCNCVAPDLVETPQVPYRDLVSDDDWWRWRMWAPLGRPGLPEDVAGAVLFLASPMAAFVTGTTIHVDGGSMAAGGWFAREDGTFTNRPYQP